jgi:hypothetical protein
MRIAVAKNVSNRLGAPMMSNVVLGTALAFASLLFGCASKTKLITTPPGAKVYVDSRFHGLSPVEYRDRRSILATTRVRFELDGYQKKTAELRKNGSIHPGGFFTPFFLWIRKYQAEYHYQLEPMAVLHTFSEAYRSAAASVGVGDPKGEVLRALLPTQAGIDPKSERAPESFVRADGVRVDIYYLRSNFQPGGRIDRSDYTPYVFNDDVLVSVGWEALNRPNAR